MNIPTVIKVLGTLLIFLSVIILSPLSLAFFEEVHHFAPFFKASAICAITGLFFRTLTKNHTLRFSSKEGFGIVTFGWILLCFFGSLPYVFLELPGGNLSVTDAYFETMSGLSTTGASIITDIESLPRVILLWRSLTHWLGGMGIIVLFLAILPAMGAGGFQLFRAEIPGPTKDKISPKIANTAKTLWGIYILLTLLCFLALWSTKEMSIFESICHTFGTIATGGFSTRNESIASFESWKIDAIITFFMFLSGCNFMLYLQMLRGNFRVLNNEELKLYSSSIVLGIIFITLLNMSGPVGEMLEWPKILLDSCFQVVCIITSTGYATADYNTWPLLAQFILLTLMMMGACAGSTGGGMKVFRVLVSLKVAFREIGQLLHPRAVLPFKIDNQHISDELTHVIIGFVSIFILLLGFFTFIVILLEGGKYNIISLFSICVSCLSNIGPGLDHFGPTNNYSPLTDTTKWILSFMMLLGRLELYSVLVIFNRSFWKK
ncbi:MAG: TrkH family potassium uptake protein [Planctomycetes bacterium]|nr:TrkH family potassium uptake protein [Planctomycetota bacterium]